MSLNLKNCGRVAPLILLGVIITVLPCCGDDIARLEQIFERELVKCDTDAQVVNLAKQLSRHLSGIDQSSERDELIAKARTIMESPHDFLQDKSPKALAESDPEKFQRMFREKALNDLLLQRNNPELPVLNNYYEFVLTIENEKTRDRCLAVIKNLRENYYHKWYYYHPIKLSDRWHEIKGNPVAKEDLAKALRMAGVVACSARQIEDVLKPVQGLQLLDSVSFLDPLDKAVDKWDNQGKNNKLRSKKSSSRNRVETAGIPLDTFMYYSYDLESDSDGANRLLFITDSLDRVVAIQKLCESPKSSSFSSSRGGTEASVYNFVQNRRKGTGSYTISYSARKCSRPFGHSITNGETSLDYATICIKTKLYDSDGRCREWAQLYVPNPLAMLFMYCCQDNDD